MTITAILYMFRNIIHRNAAAVETPPPVPEYEKIPLDDYDKDWYLPNCMRRKAVNRGHGHITRVTSGKYVCFMPYDDPKGLGWFGYGYTPYEAWSNASVYRRTSTIKQEKTPESWKFRGNASILRGKKFSTKELSEYPFSRFTDNGGKL